MIASRVRSLLSGRFGAYLLADSQSNLGIGVFNVAMTWHITQQLKVPEFLGLFFATQAIPFLILPLCIGKIIDRNNKIVMQCILQYGYIVIAILSILIGAKNTGIVFCLLLSLLFGLISACSIPIKHAISASLVSGAQLHSSISLNSFAFNLCKMLAPVIAGLLIASLGVNASFLMTAFFFLPLALYLRTKRGVCWSPETNPDASYFTGVSFVLANRKVKNCASLLLFLGLISFNFDVVGPLVVTSAGPASPRAFGVCLSALGWGALLGSLKQIYRPNSGGTAIGYWVILVGAMYLVMALSTDLGVIFAALFGCGFFAVLILNQCNRLFISSCPSNMRGSVMCIYVLVVTGVKSVGSVFIGGMFSHLGVEAACLMIAGLTVLLGSTFLVYRRMTE